MRIEQVYYFLDVAQTLSIAKSAGNLFISPQALSQSIAKLEREFGIALFDRTKHGFVLSGEGEYFREYAEELARSYSRFEHQVTSLKEHEFGDRSDRERLNLIMPHLFFAARIAQPLAENLHQDFPSLVFAYQENSLDELIGIVSCDGFLPNAIGFTIIPDFRLDKQTIARISDNGCLVVEQILRMPVVARAREGSAVSGMKVISRKELSKMQLACFNEPIIESILRELLKDYGEPDIVMKGSTEQVLCLHKDAVTISVGLVKPVDGIVTIPILNTIKVVVAEVFLKDAPVLTRQVAGSLKRSIQERYVQCNF
jgi:molybdenum-dependent DNA-binding transcriptional regulator ModE